MSVRVSTATLAALALGFAGCGPSASRADSPSVPAAAHEAAPVVPVVVAKPALPPIADGAAVPIAVLLELAAQANPNQQILAANRAAAAAIIRQAGAWANPELELSAGRAKAREANEDGVRPSTTIGGIDLKQRFELPGKRSARITAAEAQRSITEREAAVDRLELDIEIRSAALAVASAAAHMAQAAHGVELSTQVSTAVEQRMRAGETDRGDLARARVDLANAQLAADSAQAEAIAARAALRAWCGDALPEQFTVVGVLPDAPAAVAVADLQRRAVATHPRLAVFDAQRSANAAAIAAEERAWYPDLTLGVSGNRETDTNDLGVSLGMELPLWNRNDGSIAKAHADLSRLQAERRKELLALQRQVVAAWGAYERERRQIAGLSEQVIPAAQDALKLKLASFQAGDATLLEVIDARRAELSAETALTEARERAAQARIDLTRAVGADPIDPIPSTSPSSTPSASAGAQP
jgi:outer membrane protein, heavy metal efflux system